MGKEQKSGLIVDAHCHLELYDDPDATVSLSMESGIGALITSGWTLKSSKECAGLTRLKGVYATVGLGPEGSVGDSGLIEELERIAKTNKKVVGIGEIGLDTKALEKVSQADQESLFMEQLDLAEKLRLPPVIHSRGMLSRIIEILDERKTEKAMFHFFGGNEEDAKKLERQGYLMSIPPLDSGRLKRVISAVGIESLVAETDAPLVGKLPSDAVKVVEKIAVIKGKGPEEVGLIITQTIKDYFGIIIGEGP